MAKKSKYYVVWKGIEPGIYDNWEDCEEQVSTFPGARFKSFPSYDAAVKAFREGSDDATALLHLLTHKRTELDYSAFPEIDTSGIAVEAAGFCPVPSGTNNIGEYLAIVHAMAYCAQRGESRRPIYSDSRTGMSWVRMRRARTRLTPSPANEYLRQVIARADRWLQTHELTNPLHKWETETWGEIPADFDRK